METSSSNPQNYKIALNRIKTTINDLKQDISKMKIKSENAFNNIISSFPQTDQCDSIDNNQSYHYEANTSNSMLMNQSESPYKKTYEINKSDYISKEDEEFANQSIKYEIEILRLKKEIQNLDTENTFLSAQLSEQEKNNKTIEDDINKENTLIAQINKSLNIDVYKDNALEQLNKMNSEYNEEMAKNEFINGLRTLYVSQNNVAESDVDIKTIWRWIKGLIASVDELNNENENIIEEINNVSQDIENYKGYCDGLIQNLGLHSVEELKGFVNELILKKNIDRKRVHKLKKVLVGNVD